MWRPGPAGSGTLCNGCGLLWKQGKILKGAPVISKEEERRQARQERIRLLAQEKERERLEIEKQTKIAPALDAQAGLDLLRGYKDVSMRPSQPVAVAAAARSNIGYFAALTLAATTPGTGSAGKSFSW